MKIELTLESPYSLNARVTARMTLGEWRELSKKLDGIGYPANHFKSLIDETIRKVEQVFEAKLERIQGEG